MNQMPKSVKAIKIRCYSSDSEATSLSFVSSRNIEFSLVRRKTCNFGILPFSSV